MQVTYNGFSVLAAAVAAFIVSSVYYIVLSAPLKALHATAGVDVDMRSTPAWTKLAEFLRTLLLAAVVAFILAASNSFGLGPSALIAVILWVGFPFTLLTGSVMWEKVPWKIAAIHAGDWLPR